MNNYNKGFTLVELIVVITILAVLWTIAFVSFQWYALSSRDSARITDLKSIQRVLSLYKISSWVYPAPSNSTNIVFSGSTIWSQGTFGTSVYQEVGRLSNIPVDPLTNTEYTYSSTHSRSEYEIAWTFESANQQSNIIHSSHAGDRLWVSYITWEYNGQTISLSQWNTIYILAVPTIINSDLNDQDYQSIISSWNLAIKNSQNLWASYSGTVFNHLWWGNVIGVNPWEEIVFSGSQSTIQQNIWTIVSNLQDAYTGTVSIAADNTWIWKLMTVDLLDFQEVSEYASSILGTEILGSIVNSNSGPLVNGACGVDNGGAFSILPINLCNSWNASVVVDTGEWSTYNWSCNGTWWGTTDSCSANHLLSNAYPGCDTQDITVWANNGYGPYTISACNIGTNIAWLTPTSYGSYFQWWNNYTFPSTGFTTSISKVDTSWYWPWNYYSGSTFISLYDRWSISADNNLWGGDGNNVPYPNGTQAWEMQWPCADWYHIPTRQEWTGIWIAWWYGSGGWSNMKDALLLPFAWHIKASDASENLFGSNWFYWSSTPNSTINWYRLAINNSVINVNTRVRASGQPIRCFKN